MQTILSSPPPPEEPAPKPTPPKEAEPVKAKAINIKLPESVYTSLSQISRVLLAKEAMQVRVEINSPTESEEGHSEALADLVKKYLVDEGVPEGRIDIKPKGGTGDAWIDIVVTKI